jgi:hypothetical protein
MNYYSVVYDNIMPATALHMKFYNIIKKWKAAKSRVEKMGQYEVKDYEVLRANFASSCSWR